MVVSFPQMSRAFDCAEFAQKRFEETLAGLQADINTKINARQGVQDELDVLLAAKEKPSTPAETHVISSSHKLPPSSPTFGTPAGATDGETERDDASREVVNTAGATREASFEDDDDDDLFGDGDDDAEGEEEAGAHVAGGGTHLEAEAIDIEGASFEEGGDEEIDDEMAAMLNAELGNIGEDVEGDPALGDDPAAGLPESLFSDSANIDWQDIDQLMRPDEEVNFDEPAATGGFGVEGGVGMRRLATGVMEDDDDGDSDSSESSG